MSEILFHWMTWLERLGVGLSLAAWFAVAAGVAGTGFVLRRESRRFVWLGALGVAGVSLAANLTDYVVTLVRSPDLAMEANPLWRNVVETFGLSFARWYGLSGKVLVSLLAGLLFAYYLANLPRLFPRRAGSLGEFLVRMGNRSAGPRERILALFTLFAFFFAGIQPLYFYVAWLNLIDDPVLYARLPSVPSAIALLLVVVGSLFSLGTYRAFVSHEERAG